MILGEVYDNDNYENFPITVKTVKFTTQLSDKPMYKFYLTHKFIVSKKDKNTEVTKEAFIQKRKICGNAKRMQNIENSKRV